MIEIRSNEEIDIEHNFRVAAGPGAGKTHWLITHIGTVLRNSRRLAKTGKVACITYTNTGVAEIQKRLRTSAERVDVSTIHSFLYENFVSPYGFLIRDEDGSCPIDLSAMDGHEDHIPAADIIYRWKSETGQTYLRDHDKLYECLANLCWRIDEEHNPVLGPRDSWRLKNGDYYIKRDSFVDYKKYYWERGQIHHDDVLYFAYRLTTQHPEIVSYVSAKYPYVFVDEFQDTSPMQTVIIKMIADGGSIVGVIGDPAQSIFKFQGASRQDFVDFALGSMKDYQISGNRRSSHKIVELLNNMRKDGIQQRPLRNVEGAQPVLLIGDRLKAVDFVRGIHGEPTILARNNDLVGQIRGSRTNSLGDLWSKSRASDSNGDRQRMLHLTISGLDFMLSANYQEARKMIGKLFRKNLNGTRIPRDQRRACAIGLLQELAVQHENTPRASVTDYNNWLVDLMKYQFGVPAGAAIKRGGYKTEFSDLYTWEDLLQSLRSEDEESHVRTIHKAKSAEFCTVLVAIEDEEELKHIVKPDIGAADDDSRIYYVALSRAQDHLYLSVPRIEEKERTLAESLGLRIVTV
jgi:DNA helicase-2/ATP-dependent DNA helicase PcrA